MGGDARAIVLDRTIIAGSTGYGISMAIDHDIHISCTDIWGNQSGDWVGFLAPFEGVDGNICADPLFCDPDSLALSIRVDSPCAPHSPAHPQCGLTGAWPVGCPAADVPVHNAPFSEPRLTLAPNPFTGDCLIRCTPPISTRDREITIAVYDIHGRMVRRLLDRVLPGGVISLQWDGTDASGRPLPSGAYFLASRAGGKRSVQGIRIVR